MQNMCRLLTPTPEPSQKAMTLAGKTSLKYTGSIAIIRIHMQISEQI